MSLKDDIQNAMKESSTTLINTRLRNIADMTGMQDDEVRQKLKDMPFEKYVDLMRALRDVDAETAKSILVGDIDEGFKDMAVGAAMLGALGSGVAGLNAMNDPSDNHIYQAMTYAAQQGDERAEEIADNFMLYADEAPSSISGWVNANKELVAKFKKKTDEAYSGGGTLSPSEMRAQQSGQSAGASKAQKTQAMQRLGSKNLGGATAAQSSDALDKASQGKPLTPVQRKAMAQQADSVSKLASDPKTATQFRNLLNKLDRK